jgi:hypothetical protein
MEATPVTWLTYCQCLYFIPGLLKTLISGRFLIYYLICVLSDYSMVNGPSWPWVLDLVGFSFIPTNFPLNLIDLEFMAFTSRSIV